MAPEQDQGKRMSKVIRIGDIEFDARQYAINGTGVLGIKKSGKSWLAKGIAEQMLLLGIPIVVFDAIGVWRHLKRASGPSGRGFPIVVAGGKEPDLPLTPANAKEIVRAAIRENIPLVIDLYDRALSKADWRKIVQTCCRTLLYENEGVRHVFLEEAGEYVPQKVMDGETFAEVEKLVRMGGNASLGITLINPRAQEINKAVLELCENLVVMKQRGAHAIDSLEKWMDRLDPGQAKAIAASLPKLTTGECWIFSGEDDKVHRTRSGKLLTFHPDRSKPETAGTVRAAVVNDSLVSRLKSDLAAVVEETKANDPAVLREEIARLKKANAGAGYDEDKAYERGRADGYAAGARDAFAKGREHIVAVAQKFDAAREAVSALYEPVTLLQGLAPPTIEQRAQGGPLKSGKTTLVGKDPVESMVQRSAAHVSDALQSATRKALGDLAHHVQRVRFTAAPRNSGAGSADLPKGERAVLTAIAQFDGVESDQLQVLTGYKLRSVQEYLSRLRGKGFVEQGGWPAKATRQGVAALGNFEPLPTGRALLAHWRSQLPPGELKVLDVVISHYPDGIHSEDVAGRTDYKLRSVQEYVSRLRARRLVERRGGKVYASEGLAS
jgi:hypothetical protein